MTASVEQTGAGRCAFTRMVMLVLTAVLACSRGAAEQEPSAMKITSSAFQNNGTIPQKYTCDGSDVIPPLSFEGIPQTAASLALVVDDPDAPRGTWDHWVVWNIPVTASGIAEGATPEGVVGRNSWKKNSWGGPCPPDREHRYFFKLYALDTRLDLAPDAGKGDLERAMKGHILGQSELVGRYDRPGR